ncbi:hypothetical protein ACFLT1_03715 [Bacteroidota bacterium]
MQIVTARLVIAFASVIMTFGSGLWLSKIGRPLNTLLFTFHKLISLVTAVFLILGFIQLLKSIPMDARLSMLIAGAGAALALTLASGGVLSFDKFAHTWLIRSHLLLTILCILLAGLSLYYVTVN